MTNTNTKNIKMTGSSVCMDCGQPLYNSIVHVCTQPPKPVEPTEKCDCSCIKCEPKICLCGGKCKTCRSLPQNDWEKELLLQFFAYSQTPEGNFVLHSETDRERFDELKQFIRSLLANQKKALIEKVEKMKVKFIENNFYGSEKELDDKIKFQVAYNNALADIKEVINGK